MIINNSRVPPDRSAVPGGTSMRDGVDTNHLVNDPLHATLPLLDLHHGIPDGIERQLIGSFVGSFSAVNVRLVQMANVLMDDATR